MNSDINSGLGTDQEQLDRIRASRSGEVYPNREHKPWCGDPSLSRPADECTCHIPPGQQISKWVDEAMFRAAPLAEEGEEVRPRVTIIDVTTDPLRVMAAAWFMYKGEPRTPDDISQAEAVAFAKDCLKSKIAAPLEWCQISILISGVSRDFTHQIVRQRTATFVQESMRFAVKDNAASEVPTPPSIAVLAKDHPLRVIADDHVARTGWVYNALVNGGIPAEDARKYLLIGTATQLHYRTNLRDLVHHSGLRLCSQAQAEWKEVWKEIVRALLADDRPSADLWQWREIVRLFRPVCYQTGKCEFMGQFDRWCVIRERVEAHHANGDRPETWTDIHPHECLHVEAARRA
jgi:flavin-dependent thymidylate synthase